MFFSRKPDVIYALGTHELSCIELLRNQVDLTCESLCRYTQRGSKRMRVQYRSQSGDNHPRGKTYRDEEGKVIGARKWGGKWRKKYGIILTRLFKENIN